MWLRALRLGYREVGPMFPVILTEAVSYCSIPLMEEIVVTAPNWQSNLDIWESWQQELEPLLFLLQKKRAGRHYLMVDYMLRGKIAEAFILSNASIVLSMFRSMLGRRQDVAISTNMKDRFGTFEEWGKLWGSKITYEPNLKHQLMFEFSDADMTARNVGHQPVRFAAARDRYHEIVKKELAFQHVASLLDFAAAVIKTSRKQFTRQTIAEEIGATETQYSNALAERGLTHRNFFDSVQMSRVSELQELGYSDQKVLSALGMSDPRKLSRLIDRVSQ
jgi:hypothetical protein